MSLDKFRPDELAQDAIPRCRREHLRDHAKHWGGSVSIPAPPGAVGAIRTMFGDRIAFYACASNRELLEMRGMGGEAA